MKYAEFIACLKTFKPKANLHRQRLENGIQGQVRPKSKIGTPPPHLPLFGIEGNSNSPAGRYASSWCQHRFFNLIKNK